MILLIFSDHTKLTCSLMKQTMLRQRVQLLLIVVFLLRMKTSLSTDIILNNEHIIWLIIVPKYKTKMSGSRVQHLFIRPKFSTTKKYWFLCVSMGPKSQVHTLVLEFYTNFSFNGHKSCSMLVLMMGIDCL